MSRAAAVWIAGDTFLIGVLAAACGAGRASRTCGRGASGLSPGAAQRAQGLALQARQKAALRKSGIQGCGKMASELRGTLQSAPRRPLEEVEVLCRAVEEGAAYGWQRAHKYTDAPGKDVIVDQIVQGVLNAICECFDFDDGAS